MSLMLSVANKPFMLNVVMLNVVAPKQVLHCFRLLPYTQTSGLARDKTQRGIKMLHNMDEKRFVNFLKDIFFLFHKTFTSVDYRLTK